MASWADIIAGIAVDHDAGSWAITRRAADYPPLARQVETAAANLATLHHLQARLPVLRHAGSSAAHEPPADPKAGW